MMRQCKTEGCSNPPAKHRRDCNPCRNNADKARDLPKWAFRKWKSNAKRRGIVFTITLAYFRQFCIDTDILNGRGIGASSLHIDKIDDALGYVPGNLQPLTNSDNARKENNRRKRIAWVSTYDETGRYEKGGRLRMLEDGPDEPETAEEHPF